MGWWAKYLFQNRWNQRPSDEVLTRLDQPRFPTRPQRVRISGALSTRQEGRSHFPKRTADQLTTPPNIAARRAALFGDSTRRRHGSPPRKTLGVNQSTVHRRLAEFEAPRGVLVERHPTVDRIRQELAPHPERIGRPGERGVALHSGAQSADRGRVLGSRLAYWNATPIRSAARQATRHWRVILSPSSMRSNSFGIPAGLVTVTQAPPNERSRTLQSIVVPSCRNEMTAPFSTRVRCVVLCSTIGLPTKLRRRA